MDSTDGQNSLLAKLLRAALSSMSNGTPVLYFGEIAMVIGLVILVIWFSNRERESGFRVRESDLRKPKGASGNKLLKDPSQDPLANAKMDPKAKPLRLTGISLEGEPYEILGIRADASADQIQKAYRDLMKKYHPDIVGRPGSREWQDSQKIAETINRAKSEMLAKQTGKKPT
jgi:DnaJ-domain-containing protein 1